MLVLCSLANLVGGSWPPRIAATVAAALAYVAADPAFPAFSEGWNEPYRSGETVRTPRRDQSGGGFSPGAAKPTPNGHVPAQDCARARPLRWAITPAKLLRRVDTHPGQRYRATSGPTERARRTHGESRTGAAHRKYRRNPNGGFVCQLTGSTDACGADGPSHFGGVTETGQASSVEERREPRDSSRGFLRGPKRLRWRTRTSCHRPRRPRGERTAGCD